MKKYLVLAILLTSIVTNAQITKQLGDFTTLKVYNGIDVDIVKSDENKIVIEGEKAEKVKIKNVDGVLKLVLKFPELYAKGKAKATLYLKNELDVIDGNEDATITGKGFSQKALEIRAQERAFINLVIDVEDLKVRATSGGIIKLTGSSKTQYVDTDLYGIYHGYGVTVEDSTKVISGTGAKAEVNAGKKLETNVTFGGSIFYKGSPDTVNNSKITGGIVKKVQ